MKTSNYAAFFGSRASRPQFLISRRKHPLRLRLSLCLVLAGSMTHSAFAQPQEAWVARYNNGIAKGTNQAVKMALDSNGNIYVTGFSQNANSNLGYVTIKYAPNGTQLWASRYDSTNYPAAEPAAMVLDASNDVIVTGSALTIKYNCNGNQLWTAPYAGTALAVDSNANVYVAGFSQNFGTEKLTPQGSNVWLTTYTDVGPTISQSVLVDSGNNVYVSGLDTYYTAYRYTGPYVTLATIQYGSNGNRIWISSLNPPPWLQYNSVQVAGAMLDGSNNLYLLGNFSGGVSEPYVAFKYSTNGSLVWTAFPNRNDSSEATALYLDSGANLLITGKAGYYPDSSYGTYKINTGGLPVWTNCYPQVPVGLSVATSIVTDSANNSYVTGYSPGANSNNDIVTIKYDANGNQVWLQCYNGPGNGNDAGNAIAVDSNGNVYVTGYETTAAGGTEIVTIKYLPVTPIQRQSDGSILLQAQGSPGESFDFQGSADLVNWEDLGSVFADTNGVAQFDDTNAPQYNCRFYTASPQ